MTTRLRKTITSSLVFLVCLLLFIAAIYYTIRDREDPEAVLIPTCKIVILEPSERISRANATVSTFDELESSIRPPGSFRPIPETEAENPVLLSSQFAELRFSNSTDRPLSLFTLVPSLGATPNSPGLVLIVEIEIRDEDGRVLEVPGSPLLDLTVPDPKVLKANNPPTITLQPGEPLDISMSILGRMTTRKQGLKDQISAAEKYWAAQR